MTVKPKPDFGGYATRAGLVCSDGVTIMPDAFKHQDQAKVPLVWGHNYDGPTNILGHAILSHRADGVYTEAFFNDTADAQLAKQLVKHGDITALSIHARQLKKNKQDVTHGYIKEVSLVVAGANPGAFIDYVDLSHGEDGSETEGVIYTGLEFETGREEAESAVQHADTKEETVADTKEKTVADVYNEFTDEQKNVVHYMIGEAVEAAEDAEDDDQVSQSEFTSADVASDIIKHMEEKGMSLTHNVFDQDKAKEAKSESLTHAQQEAIFEDAKKGGGQSLKDVYLSHAATYGFDPIETLFPEAKLVASGIETVKRRTEWVNDVLSGVKKSPFSRIKSIVADITADEARAKGYVKGNLKKEEIIKLLKRKTGPTTIYKKQKLDRDDILDITDFDIVVWMKGEMRVMLDEEIARAVLVGDGRAADDEDKIDTDAVRPIAFEDDFYAGKFTLAAGISPRDKIDSLVLARADYRGSGTPTYFTTLRNVTEMLLIRDGVGRRLYETVASLTSALMVDKIVMVEAMEEYPAIDGIFVNLSDYTIGADKGGDVSFFDDFDLDYNQYKYLLETRISGALTKPRSAVVVLRATGTRVTPTQPTFNGTTDTITIPTKTGVEYTIDGVVVTGDKVITRGTTVRARATSGSTLADGAKDEWYYSPTEDEE